MKKIVHIAICFCAIILPSCDDTETYADKLRKEQEVISFFFDQNDREIIREYPENGVFGKGEFFFEPQSGVYFHVIDSGNGRRATTGRQVYVRYHNAGSLVVAEGLDSLCFDSNDTNGSIQDYLNFTYNDPTT
jgi:FKBP-type peptidyl-prolyl cis-trans isomerase